METTIGKVHMCFPNSRSVIEMHLALLTRCTELIQSCLDDVIFFMLLVIEKPVDS